MQVNLPEHQSSGNQELLNGIDPLMIDDKFVVYNIQHPHDPVGADDTFGNPGKETVPFEIIQSIHIQLT